MDSLEYNVLKENEKIIDNLIEIKRFQLNHIWANKITQEDINIPRKCDTNDDNYKQAIIILNSARKLNDKILKIFLEFNNKNPIINNLPNKISKLILYTCSLIQKLKNINEIKIKSLKFDKNFNDCLKKNISYFKDIKNKLKGNAISKKFLELYENLITQSDLLFGEKV
jgi:hypothetical protein